MTGKVSAPRFLTVPALVILLLSLVPFPVQAAGEGNAQRPAIRPSVRLQETVPVPDQNTPAADTDRWRLDDVYVKETVCQCPLRTQPRGVRRLRPAEREPGVQRCQLGERDPHPAHRGHHADRLSRAVAGRAAGRLHRGGRRLHDMGTDRHDQDGHGVAGAGAERDGAARALQVRRVPQAGRRRDGLRRAADRPPDVHLRPGRGVQAAKTRCKSFSASPPWRAVSNHGPWTAPAARSS